MDTWLFLYALFSRQVVPILRNRYFYVSSAIIIGTIGGYYGICEWIHPGHFGDVWRMELLPRYTNTSANNAFTILSDKWYYVKQISYEKYFFPLWQWLPLCLLVGLDANQVSEKQLTYFILITVSTFLLIISNGCANDWYDAPVYPLLAMLSGIGLSFFYRQLLNRISTKPKILRQSFYAICFLALFFATVPYYFFR